MKPSVKVTKKYRVKLQKCIVFYVGILLFMNQPGISSGAKCGRPGRTKLNWYEPSGSEFNEGDKIRYVCTEKDLVILGKSERQCLRNGTWSDDIPVCSKVAVLEDVEMFSQNSNEGKLNTKDGNISTCSEASKFNVTVWRGFLSTSINISAAQISIFGTREVDIDVTVQEDNSSGGKRCKIKSDDSDSSIKSIKTLNFFCPASTVGKYVRISCNCQSVQFCEISVLQPIDSCLSPDIPLHGNGFKIHSEEKSEYRMSCQEGFKKWGVLAVTCQVDGRWFPKSPVCEEIYCDPPSNIEHGTLEHSMRRGRIPYNGTAKYTCHDGFYLDGHSIIRCHRWNEWDHPPPTCKPRVVENKTSTRSLPFTESWKQTRVIQCGSLPHIANGAFIVNSSNVGSIAWLKCSDGFKPLTDEQVVCLPSGQWSSQSLHCTVIQCNENPIIPHGRAILLHGNSYYGSHLEIRCNQGYTAFAPITRKCDELGTWGDLDICVEITCGEFDSDDSEPDQWLSVNGSTSLRVLICPENFHIEGSPAVTRCLSNGSWSFTTAKCKKSFTSFWGNNWTPSLVLIAAIAAGVGTAIIILCLSVACLVVKKRHQAQANTTVFHLENVLHKDRMRDTTILQQVRHSDSENYNMIERRTKSVSTNLRKPRSALPNLPVDADPVYAQPFETVTAKKSLITANKKDDFNNHIYAEPVDSRRHTPTHVTVNISNPRTGTDRRLSAVTTNFENATMRSVSNDLKNCDKTCAIYDTSRKSSLSSGQLLSEENAVYDSSKNPYISDRHSASEEKCVIYDSSRNSDLKNGQLTPEETIVIFDSSKNPHLNGGRFLSEEKCAIYNNTENSSTNGSLLKSNEHSQKTDGRTEIGTLMENLDYMELL